MAYEAHLVKFLNLQKHINATSIAANKAYSTYYITVKLH